MSVYNYQLTEWVLNEGELKSHMKSLRKHGTPYELKEQMFGKTVMYAIFIAEPNHERDYEDAVDND